MKLNLHPDIANPINQFDENLKRRAAQIVARGSDASSNNVPSEMFNFNAEEELDKAMDVTTGKKRASDIAVLGSNTDITSGDVQNLSNAREALETAKDAKQVKEPIADKKSSANFGNIKDIGEGLAKTQASPYANIDPSTLAAARMPTSKDIISARLNALQRLSAGNRLG